MKNIAYLCHEVGTFHRLYVPSWDGQQRSCVKEK